MALNNSLSDSPTGTFPLNSRYHGLPTSEYVSQGDRRIMYLQRRFLPRSDAFQTIQFHSLSDGDRLDLIAASYFGDSLLYWRLCDSNGAMRPEDLLARDQIAITLPEGIQGSHL